MTQFLRKPAAVATSSLILLGCPCIALPGRNASRRAIPPRSA